MKFCSLAMATILLGCQALHAQTFEMPFNRQIKSAGHTITFGDGELENHSLDAALLPGDQQVVVEDRYGIAVIDITSQNIVYRWQYNANEQFKGLMGTFSGIHTLLHNGVTYVGWGASARSVSKVMLAEWDGRQFSNITSIDIAAKAPARNALANEVVFSVEGNIPYLYTTLNGNNEVHKYELLSKKLVWSAATGNAPFGVCIAGGKVFVTNWAGPQVTDTTRPHAGVPWGNAYTSPVTGATAEGSVSVFNMADGKLEKEIAVGLHPNAIKPDNTGQYVYVANANSDEVSQVNVQTLLVESTTPVGLFSQSQVSTGSSPNGLGFHPNGNMAFVANGLDNAVAVLQLPRKGKKMKVLGYIPTEAYPSGVVFTGNKILATNLEARGAGVLSSPGDIKRTGQVPAEAYSIHKQLASVSIIKMPRKRRLKQYTRAVQVQNMQSRMVATLQPPRPNQPARPVPERIGEPSVFKHVVYIIKENKTYDQVFGDIASGNGDSSLCVFGKNITPNEHAIAAQYGLMDQYYASGKSSAEGHQWTDGAMVSDYVEKNVRAWLRSYPHRQEDALVYNKSGFIWNQATHHGKTVRVFGEACTTVYDSKLRWSDMYNLYINNNLPPLRNKTTIAPLRPLISPNYPDCDNMVFNDQMRADVFIKEWKQFEQNNNLPHLLMLSLPNDHTAGTSPNWPTPNAMVADNDLAVGRILEVISHSKFWDSTVVFITQDDSQSGWDHISPYRTVGMVASAYNKPGTVSTVYNQTCMVRTIEQILGIPPMNVIDATAKTMSDCFTSQPVAGGNRFTHLKNNIPLNQMNPGAASLSGKAKEMALLSAREAFKEEVDNGNDDAMNRILWFYAKGNQPYPENNGKK